MKLVAIEAHTMKLYNGRRSWYLALTLLGRVAWLQRWDTARAPRNRFCWADMGWTWGTRS
jgi:hypothetical protein